MPLIVARWEHSTASTFEGQGVASTYLQMLVDEGTMPAPAVRPLVVGETIVFRGADQMYGIDFETGLRKWVWPPQFAWNDNPKKQISVPQRRKLKQRMVADSIYGQASSDGRLIFFVPSPGGSSGHENENEYSVASGSEPSDLRMYNELVAIDSENSGMLRWRVGGPTGFDEPKLAKAYFIGEALPLEGLLYCCCVHDNAIQIVALDSQTGELKWSQAIAGYDRANFNANHMRRMAGVSPSYADGKIVCMTGTGAVVALDVSTRTLLWGYEYKLQSDTNMVSDDSGYANALKDAWRDSQVTIANGMVFLTPVLSREVICLDLDEGLGVWFEEDGFLPQRVDRESSLYLAGINQDLLIFVGTRHIRAIDSFTGRESWRLPLEIDDFPSGRGYIGDDSLFLPTASRKMFRIDLVNGKIVESVATGRILGNLSRVKGDVVSHGVDHVASYPEYGASTKSIEDLRDDQLNEQQKFIKSQTLIQRGDLEAGLRMFNEIAVENPQEKYAQFLRSCAVNFQTDNPAFSLTAIDSLKRMFPDFDVKELEMGRAIAKLRTGEFAESVMLSLDQLEEQFAKINGSANVEISSEVYKTIAARLIDQQLPNEAPDDAKIDGLEQIEFDNRNDRIKFSEFGWHRTRLHLGMEGLESKDSDAYDLAQQRISTLVADNIEQPSAQLDWLLARVPTRVLDLKTLELLANRFLKEKRLLAALMYANAALETEQPEAERVRMLKAEILVAGNDLQQASTTINSTDGAALDASGNDRLVELQKEIASLIQANSDSVRSSTNWTDSKWPIAEAEVVVGSSSTKQNPARYRLPIEFDAATEPRFRNMRLFLCPWGDRKVELEMRSSRGNLIHSMRIRRPEEDGSSFGYVRRCHVDIQNYVTELSLNKESYYGDWFSFIAGDGGYLWKSPHKQVTPLQTAFSGGRETVIAVGQGLYCYETRTGTLIWNRKFDDGISRVLSHGSQLTTWSEDGQRFNTIDVATGRLLRTVKSKRYAVTRTLVDKFVMSHPVRKGELSKEEEAKFVGPDGPKNPAMIANRLAVFDAGSGRIAWSKVQHLKSQRFYRAREICNLDPSGALSFIDLATGEATNEIQLPISDTEKATLQGINVRHHRAGWVVHVKCRDRGSSFNRGKVSYQYSMLHVGLGSGPVFLLNESRNSLVWESPVHLERMEYLNNQPFDSPAIMFGRHLERTDPVKGESHYLHVVLLDDATGKLVCNEVVESYENYNGHAIAWKQPDPKQPSRTLVISTPPQVKEINFGSDSEMPPGPRAHLTFNAIDFFEDPLFEQIRSEVVDSRVEEFRRRALEAEQRRKDQQAKAAAELKKRMGVMGER